MCGSPTIPTTLLHYIHLYDHQRPSVLLSLWTLVALRLDFTQPSHQSAALAIKCVHQSEFLIHLLSISIAVLVGYVWITCYTYMAHSYIYDWWLILAVETLVCCGEFVMALWYMATSFAAFWFTVETLGLVLQRPHTATQRPDCIMLWCDIYCYTISTAQCGDWHMLPLWTFSCCGTSEKVPGKFRKLVLDDISSSA